MTEKPAVPVEPLSARCSCDWPGCRGQCHTGDSCPCHPSLPPDEDGLRAALERAIRLTEVIPYSVDVEQAGMQAEVVIETLRAALGAAPVEDET
jgi:hypothetical protein